MLLFQNIKGTELGCFVLLYDNNNTTIVKLMDG